MGFVFFLLHLTLDVVCTYHLGRECKKKEHNLNCESSAFKLFLFPLCFLKLGNAYESEGEMIVISDFYLNIFFFFAFRDQFRLCWIKKMS